MTQPSTPDSPAVPGSVSPYNRSGFYGKEATAVDLAISQIGPCHPLHVLDIGCANGRTSREFIERHDAMLVGIDLDPPSSKKPAHACRRAIFGSWTRAT